MAYHAAPPPPPPPPKEMPADADGRIQSLIRTLGGFSPSLLPTTARAVLGHRMYLDTLLERDAELRAAVEQAAGQVEYIEDFREYDLNHDEEELAKMHEEAMQRLSEASSRHRQFHSEIDALKSMHDDLDRYAAVAPVTGGLSSSPASVDGDVTPKPKSTVNETLQELNKLKDNVRKMTQTLEHVRRERDELQIQLSDEKIKSAKLHNALLERQTEHSYHYLGGCPYYTNAYIFEQANRELRNELHDLQRAFEHMHTQPSPVVAQRAASPTGVCGYDDLHTLASVSHSPWVVILDESRPSTAGTAKNADEFNYSCEIDVLPRPENPRPALDDCTWHGQRCRRFSRESALATGKFCTIS